MDIKSMDRPSIMMELKRLTQQSLPIKGTYIKTLKQEDLFETPVNKTTILEPVKVGKQQIFVPIVKEEKLTEGALSDDLIMKLLSKIKNPKSRAILKEYIEQETSELEKKPKVIRIGNREEAVTEEQQELKDRVADIIDRVKKASDTEEVNKILEEENIEELKTKLKESNLKQTVANLSRTITTLKTRIGKKSLEEEMRRKKIEAKLEAEETKRPPGRPKKEIEKEVEPEEKIKPLRPKEKVVDEEEEEVKPEVVEKEEKRKPGRPKKEVTMKVKKPTGKKRGRPTKKILLKKPSTKKKVDEEEEEEEEEDEEEEEEDDEEETKLPEKSKKKIEEEKKDIEEKLKKINDNNIYLALKNFYIEKGDKEAEKQLVREKPDENRMIYEQLVKKGKIEKGMDEKIMIGRGSSELQGIVESLDRISNERSGKVGTKIYGSGLNSKTKKYVEMVLGKQLNLNNKEKLLFYKSLYLDRKTQHPEIDSDPIYEPLRQKIKSLGGEVVGESILPTPKGEVEEEHDPSKPHTILGSLKIKRALEEYNQLKEKKKKTKADKVRIEFLKQSLILSGKKVD